MSSSQTQNAEQLKCEIIAFNKKLYDMMLDYDFFVARHEQERILQEYEEKGEEYEVIYELKQIAFMKAFQLNHRELSSDAVIVAINEYIMSLQMPDSFCYNSNLVYELYYELLNSTDPVIDKDDIKLRDFIYPKLRIVNAIDTECNLRIFINDVFKVVFECDFVELLQLLIQHPELKFKEKNVITTLFGFWCYQFKAISCEAYLRSINLFEEFIPPKTIEFPPPVNNFTIPDDQKRSNFSL